MTTEELKKKKAKYYLDNKESIKTKNKTWHHNNKIKANTISKSWYNDNKERSKENKRNWNKKGKQKIRYATDLNFRLVTILRSRLYKAVKGFIKSAKTIDLIGCSVLELQDHLEKQFTEGMTWDNCSQWHIDHKRPCASFDLSDPEQQRQCFHYSNLQPLWAIDNILKSDKYEAMHS